MPAIKIVVTSSLLASLAAAAPAPAPAPQAPSYGGAPTPSVNAEQYSSASSSISRMIFSASQVPASSVPSSAGYPRVSNGPLTGPTSHGPYSGTPTTTGAVMNSPQASTIAVLGPDPTETYVNLDGALQSPQPAPYVPAGGVGTQTIPKYKVQSDWDFESIALGLYQEWIELDSFNNGVAVFSEQDFLDAGLTAEDRSFIQFMANQESGHATLLTDMLGAAAPPQCTYDYPFTTVREFVDFQQRLTRYGESGVWGFLAHLNSKEVATLLSQSIATEARQQMAFRQMSGLHPMPVWFEAGVPQSWQWTLLAPYISSCPANTTRLAWQNFPALHIVNNANINRISPNNTANNEVTGPRAVDPSISTINKTESCEHVDAVGYGCAPGISRNRSQPLSFVGKRVDFKWDTPGAAVGPNMSYVTSSTAGAPKYVAWASQLNLTYSALTTTGPNTGYTFQPQGEVFQGDPVINGTMFVALTDANPYLTPFNLSLINPHVAALGEYMAG